MKNINRNVTHAYKSQLHIILTLGIVLFMFISCNTMSVIKKNESAGLNGDFEIVEDGFPVNWFFISPKALENHSYELVIDTTDFKGGRQSLKILVHEVDMSRDIWNNPGMFHNIDAIPGETYKTTFWLKNEGCSFRVKNRSENHPLEYEETIIQTNSSINNWQFFEHKYTVPQEYDRLGFYLHIWETGSLWIDDINIEKMNDSDSD